MAAKPKKKIRPVAKAKKKSKRIVFKNQYPYYYLTAEDQKRHIQGFMGKGAKIKFLERIETEVCGVTVHVVFYTVKLGGKFQTDAPPNARYEIYNNGVPKSGGIIGI